MPLSSRFYGHALAAMDIHDEYPFDFEAIPPEAILRAVRIAEATSCYGEPWLSPCGDGTLLLNWDLHGVTVNYYLDAEVEQVSGVISERAGVFEIWLEPAAVAALLKEASTRQPEHARD